ncbi:ExeM/NucH family extracellular endonuclease [Rothia sp. LK2588]|uniref:ExeM/NucH family extracellular endonuclease n=1 Tax=Rothia sp. LK2588 TaxID=3114369 RepID=UPI0034CD6BBF
MSATYSWRALKVTGALTATLALTTTGAITSFGVAAAAETVSIADVQGNGAASPFSGTTVTTRGVITATYPTGGLRGYFIQTEGSGGAQDATPGQSDGIFVYSPNTVSNVKIGDYVEVTGAISEYYDQTQITVSGTADLKQLSDQHAPVEPIRAAFPEDEAAREAVEGMLYLPTGDITVTNNYSTNTFGEIGLTNGAEPLRTATDVVAPGAEAVAYEAKNDQRYFVLDDGSTANLTRGGSETPVPYLSGDNPVRTGAAVTFDQPVVVSFTRDLWRLQPTQQITGDNESSFAPAHWTNTRETAPKNVGGDGTIASFNVLNYFPTTGDELTGCSFYKDRQGNPITISGGCAARGAANQENFLRQQSKIVSAINTLNASVVSLEEIENSVAFGKDRDAALNNLVGALNAAAGYEKWKAVPSPANVPTGEDVIRTGFIYQPDTVAPVGESTILQDPAFDNARYPLAQQFKLAHGDENDQTFLAIVNHFKSKGSGTGEGNTDAGDGQGMSNASRVAQAQALATFAEQQKQMHGTENAVLLGDFNSYTQEDPMQVLYQAGYTDAGTYFSAGHTYQFDGRVGSLDHVLLSGALLPHATGADVWNINAFESVGLEYSRFNNNITNLYRPDAFRSSDHDPEIVGFNLKVANDAATQPDPSVEQPGDSTEAPRVKGKKNPRGEGNNGRGNKHVPAPGHAGRPGEVPGQLKKQG